MAKCADPFAAREIGDRYLREIEAMPEASPAERLGAAVSRATAPLCGSTSSARVHEITLQALVSGLSGPCATGLASLGEAWTKVAGHGTGEACEISRRTLAEVARQRWAPWAGCVPPSRSCRQRGD